MRCPYCNHDRTKVEETRPKPDEGGDLRYRRCLKCVRRFTTMERLCFNSPGSVGYLDAHPLRVVPEPQQPAKSPAKAARAARFMPEEVPDGFGITADAAPLLLQWWRESRRSKHGSRATWTEAAWLSSASRVGALPPARQLELCTAGVENGWMALKEDYLGAHKPLGLSQISRRPMPKDPAMLAALEEPWPA